MLSRQRHGSMLSKTAGALSLITCADGEPAPGSLRDGHHNCQTLLGLHNLGGQ